MFLRLFYERLFMFSTSEVEKLRDNLTTDEWMGEVRKQMKRRHMTCRDLAAASGWSESTVRKYINGLYHNDNPRGDIEQALGMR